MEQLLIILSSVLILLGLAYVALISSYCYAWTKIESHSIIEPQGKVKVSIIIAARNEEETISNCLNSILKQSYSRENMEVIIIDDHSTDATNKKVQVFCEKQDIFRLITLSSLAITGKKQAISAGINIASGELIITTDADCIMGTNWLSAIVRFYKQTKAKMIVAPVSFFGEKSIFEKMQSLELMALMISGGSSLYFNKAIMCNGANLAYTREAFDEVNGFEGIDITASGDDVLLMYKIKHYYPKGVQFIKSEESFVYTKAKSTLKEFFNQRKRWASKSFTSFNSETKGVSLLVYFFNFMLPVFFFSLLFYDSKSCFYPSFLRIGLIILAIKCIIDFLLLFLAATFFKKRRLLIYFLPEQFLYILYVVLIGLLGRIGTYEWKGRKV